MVRRPVVRLAVVREVGERATDRRELPVDDGDDARLGGVEDEVVELEIAVDEGRGRFALAPRLVEVRGEPLHERRDVLALFHAIGRGCRGRPHTAAANGVAGAPRSRPRRRSRAARRSHAN